MRKNSVWLAVVSKDVAWFVEKYVRTAVKGCLVLIAYFGYRSVSLSTKGRIIPVYKNSLDLFFSNETFYDRFWACSSRSDSTIN